MEEVRRVLTLNLRKLATDDQLLLRHLTFNAAKLWNVVNYQLRS
ncbi:MAG: hypothetical protein ACXAEU_09700 [Candidatus Hodarchaeales archaeon]